MCMAALNARPHFAVEQDRQKTGPTWQHTRNKNPYRHQQLQKHLQVVTRDGRHTWYIKHTSIKLIQRQNASVVLMQGYPRAPVSSASRLQSCLNVQAPRVCVSAARTHTHTQRHIYYRRLILPSWRPVSVGEMPILNMNLHYVFDCLIRSVWGFFAESCCLCCVCVCARACETWKLPKLMWNSLEATLLRWSENLTSKQPNYTCSTCINTNR